MRRSIVRLRADPSLIVQKRLPWQVRKQQLLRRSMWEEEVEETAGPAKTPGAVLQISQAAKQRQNDPQVWKNMLDHALGTCEEFSAQDMASILWSMSVARFRHHAVLDQFVRILSYKSDVKAMVTAMLAVDRLELPVDTLRAPFLQQLSGQCDRLGFSDLRRVLMAFARCWQTTPLNKELLTELCDAIVVKSENTDPRDMIAIPQHLGRLRFVHAKLLSKAAGAVATVIASRLTIMPLDGLRAMDGFLLLVPILDIPEWREKIETLASKCRLLAAKLLKHAKPEDLWRVGSHLLGAEVVELQVWILWVDELVERRDDGVGRAQRVAQLRRRIIRQWGIPQPPESLEMALQACISSPGS